MRTPAASLMVALLVGVVPAPTAAQVELPRLERLGPEGSTEHRLVLGERVLWQQSLPAAPFLSTTDADHLLIAAGPESDEHGGPARRIGLRAYSDILVYCAEPDGRTWVARIERGQPAYGGTPGEGARPMPHLLSARADLREVMLWCAVNDAESRPRFRIYTYRTPHLSLVSVHDTRPAEPELSDMWPVAACRLQAATPRTDRLLLASRRHAHRR
jgi:hypothetical protein